MIKEILPRIYLQAVSLYREASRGTFFSQVKAFMSWVIAAVGRWTPGPLSLASSSVQRDEKFKRMAIVLCYPEILVNMNNSLVEAWTWKHQSFKIQLALLVPQASPQINQWKKLSVAFLFIRLEISKDAALSMSPSQKDRKSDLK